MWNQSADLKESCNTVEAQYKCTQINQVKYQAHCRFLRTCVEVCINKKCNNNAFICRESNCKCRKEHAKCLKMNTENLIENIEKKIVNDQNLERCINKRIEQFIQYLIKLREETISQIKGRSQYLGLNENEKEFLRGIKNDNCYTTTGQTIWKIIHLNQQKQAIQESFNFTLKSLNNRFNQAKKQLEKILSQIKGKVDGCFNKIKKHFQIPRFAINHNPKHQLLTKFVAESSGSKIITQVQEIQKLLYFFSPRVIKSFKVIYRASENQFSTDKFHEKCDNIPDTLVLVETQYNKKIGGYAPFKWGKQEQVGSTINTQNSFVFSLTNGDKFQPKEKSYSRSFLFHPFVKGPFFGRCGEDLTICNLSNTNCNSHSKLNSTYYNQLYQNSEYDSWNYFCGNANFSTFKTKEWQVLSLQFE